MKSSKLDRVPHRVGWRRKMSLKGSDRAAAGETAAGRRKQEERG
jgi:hypothetical protein